MLERLFDCAAADPEVARKGRWLNRLLVSFIVIGGVIVITSALLLPFSMVTITNGAAVLLLVGLYFINRRGYVGVTLWILLALVMAAVIFSATGEHDNLAVLMYPALFVLVILTTGVFLSWTGVLGAVIAVGAVTIWYYTGSTIPVVRDYQVREPSGVNLLMYTLLLLFAASGALSWLSNRLIGETLTALRRRAGDLEAALATLAEQTQREHALGANIGVLAEQLSAVSARQVTGVSSQAASISQVVSAVAELHTAADQIDATATLVSEAADSALQSVQHAQALVVQSREAVQRNRAQVHTVIERMTRVDTLTRNITVFTNGIRKLSEETQLLALNATIEAAGAGSIGRRFGVVAGEVESLAQRANEFVDQIRAIVAELQEAGQITLAATQSSSDIADEVEQLADEVRSAQEQVAGAVQRTSELVHQISTATSQQNNATEQMTETMEQIAASADMTNRETRALETVSSELLHSAEMLMSTMTRLRSQTHSLS